MGLLANMVLGIIGLFKDENKLAAIITLALPVAFFIIAIVGLVSVFGE